MTMTENIFSLFVFGETFPKPTEVKDENVKYIAVIYLSFLRSKIFIKNVKYINLIYVF